LGFDGLHDKRVGKESPRRIPMSMVGEVLSLYTENHFDFNARHFPEKLVEEHSIALSYTWVKAQAASGDECCTATEHLTSVWATTDGTT